MLIQTVHFNHYFDLKEGKVELNRNAFKNYYFLYLFSFIRVVCLTKI